MRVTMKMSTNNAINNILDNYSRLMKIQDQMGTGQRVNNPSDDPLAVNEAIRIQSLLSQMDQFTQNIKIGNSFLNLSDATLQDVNDVEKAAKALTVGLANDATTPDARRGAVVELSSTLQEIISLANRKNGDRYIFGGTLTDSPPFEVVGTEYVNFKGNSQDISMQVDHDSYIPINTKAEDVFGSLITKERSLQFSPKINMDVNTGTRLEDLNLGKGIANGSINVRYQDTAGPTFASVEINLQSADTLEDVADLISSATSGQVGVSGNSTATGIDITNLVQPGNLVEITEVANNTVARDLGILASAAGGTINGSALNPKLTNRTMLSDLPSYYGSPMTISNGTDNLQLPTIAETIDSNNQLSQYQLSGLTSGVNTDLNGKLHLKVTNLGANVQVEIFKNSTRQPQDLVAIGTVANPPANGTVTMAATNGSGLSGTIVMDNYIADDATIEAQVTFPNVFQATVQVEAFTESGDTNNQVSGWQLFGLRKGVDTGATGNLAVQIENVAGTRTVRVYNGDTLAKIAEGNIGASNDGQVTLTGFGAANAHLSGSVNLEYLANDLTNNLTLTMTNNTVKEFKNAIDSSGTYTTAQVTSDGRAIEISSRLAGATLRLAENALSYTETNDNNNQLNRWNLNGIVASTNSDPTGKLFADLAVSGAGPFTYTLNLYSDSGKTTLVASGSVSNAGVPPAETVLTITEAAGSNSGISGSVNLSWIGNDSNIEVVPQGPGISGKIKGDNIFSTLNDVINAGRNNDSETLSNLLGNFNTDINRVLGSRAEIGAKANRFDLMKNRLSDETTSFTSILSSKIDLDYSKAIVKFQQESNIFNAALSVAGRIIPMSLVDFL